MYNIYTDLWIYIIVILTEKRIGNLEIFEYNFYPYIYT